MFVPFTFRTFLFCCLLGTGSSTGIYRAAYLGAESVKYIVDSKLDIETLEIDLSEGVAI